MMLKTSSNKINPATSMFGFTIKKNLGIIVLLTIGFLLICPSYTIIYLREFDVNSMGVFPILSRWVKGLSLFCSIICGLIVISLNLLNFSFMYRRPASDFTDSLPITRVELFLSKTLSGFILSIVPAIFTLFSLGIITVIYGCTNLFINILVNICYIVLTTAVCSALSMMFIIASANIFDFLVSFAAVNGGILLVGIIVFALLENLLIGYVANSPNTILKCISPIYYVYASFAMHLFDDASAWSGVSFIAKSFVIFVVFYAFALMLYKKRKTESTGNAFAYKFLYYICAVIISFCAGYITGSLFSQNTFNVIYYIFALIGALICSVVYGAITFRGFKTIKKSLIIGGISFLLSVLTIITIKIDFAGFSKRIPEVDQVKSVSIEYGDEKITFNDSKFAIDFQNKIVNKDNIIAEIGIYSPEVHSIGFDYTLKNGDSIKRQYWIYNKKVEKEISKILKSDERFKAFNDKLCLTKPQTVTFSAYDNKSTNLIPECYLTLEEIQKFLEIYKKEVQKEDKKIYDFHESCGYYISWSDHTYYSIELYYDGTYTESIEYLESLNLEERQQVLYNEYEK